MGKSSTLKTKIMCDAENDKAKVSVFCDIWSLSDIADYLRSKERVIKDQEIDYYHLCKEEPSSDDIEELLVDIHEQSRELFWVTKVLLEKETCTPNADRSLFDQINKQCEKLTEQNKLNGQILSSKKHDLQHQESKNKYDYIKNLTFGFGFPVIVCNLANLILDASLSGLTFLLRTLSIAVSLYVLVIKPLSNKIGSMLVKKNTKNIAPIQTTPEEHAQTICPIWSNQKVEDYAKSKQKKFIKKCIPFGIAALLVTGTISSFISSKSDIIQHAPFSTSATQTEEKKPLLLLDETTGKKYKLEEMTTEKKNEEPQRPSLRALKEVSMTENIH